MNWQYKAASGFKTDTEPIQFAPGNCEEAEETEEENVPDAISEIFGTVECEDIENHNEDQTKPSLPIDVFLNDDPEVVAKKDHLITKATSLSMNYFATVNMSRLYPELFKLLWYSSLPCFAATSTSRSLIKSCQVYGVPFSCKRLFKKVLTDSGRLLK